MIRRGWLVTVAGVVVALQGPIACSSGDQAGGGFAGGSSSGSVGGANSGSGGGSSGGASGSSGAGGNSSGGSSNGGSGAGSASGSSSGGSSGGSSGSSSSGGRADAGGSSGASSASSSSGSGSGGGSSGSSSGGTLGDAGTGEGPLPGGVMAFPPPNGQGVCPDPPLRITFSGAPTLGTSGKIQVFGAAGAVVAAVDMAATTFSDTIGGTTFNIVRPAYVDGNDVVIYLKSHALGYGQTYYVNVDSGAILGPGGTPLAVTGTTSWRFSTAAAAPSNLASLTVALNGSGNFCSVQGAVDALPAGNTNATTITINAGIYHEIIHFASKNNVTLIGQDRKATIIEGTNDNAMNPSTATRSLVGIDSSSGLIIDTMTIHNLGPMGTQEEALRLQSCDKCVVRNADIISLQDTLLWSGRIYATNCYIAGDIDFIWGTGAAYFNKCEIRTVGRAGWNVQARNPASTYGYVFVDSKITADPGITGHGLARIDASVYPASHVAYINCTMGSHISPAGWTVTPAGVSTSQLRFWEYQSVDPSGAAIDVSQRLFPPISAAQAASMRDPTVVLAGWQPPP
jgi:pectin methylesterase-like acyl-CoA thioesterase